MINQILRPVATSFVFSLIAFHSVAQVKWTRVDSLFGPLPPSVHVYKTTDPLDGKPNIAYYVSADLKDKALEFTVDTTYKRRIKPSGFYERNSHPLIVVNTTFFSFGTNSSLNLVMREGIVLSPNSRTVRGRGADSVKFRPSHTGALGIGNNRDADIAWIKSGTNGQFAEASQNPPVTREAREQNGQAGKRFVARGDRFKRWKVRTAVGGGPVLIQKGQVRITNEEESMFAGKAINDKHPRTAIGYTAGDRLIILVIEGRNPGVAEGASLPQEARMLRELGCWEALNLDGGGSSCLLVNGMETIKPSDKEGQRAIPAVFIVKTL